MKKAHVLALTGMLLAISCIQPASAATLHVINKTAKPALVTITDYTNFCKDDRGIHVAPNGTFTPKAGLCIVKMAYASNTTSPGFALSCIPHNRTGGIHVRRDRGQGLQEQLRQLGDP